MSAKRILSGLLAMVLLLGCVPMTALAEETAPAAVTAPVVLTPEIIVEPEITEEVIPETTAAPIAETTEETTEAATEPAETEPVLVIVGEEAAMAGGELGDGLEWSYDAETFTLTISGSGEMYDNYAPWSGYAGKIRTIVIGEGVRSIGEGAFADLSALTKVTLPSTLEYIGAFAFAESSLPKIEIPASVYFLGSSAFAGCKSLKKVTFQANSNLEIIGDSAFQGSGLAEIALPDSVATIQEKAFQGCESLKTVTLSDTLGTIGASAFKNTAMETIALPDSLTAIGSEAFSGTALTSVKIPSGVKAVNVGTGVFKDCDALVSATVPSFWAQIPAGMFEGCHVLTGFAIPSGVTKIGARAFKYCYALTDVTLPAALTLVGEEAFAYCEGLQEIVFPAKVEVLQHEAFAYCANLKLIRFEGDAPAIAVNEGENYGSFYKVTADVLYPRDNVTWTAAVRKNYGGTLTWNISYPLDIAVDPDTGKPRLTWGQTEGAVKYKIYRSAKADTGFKLIKTFTDTTKVTYLDQDQDTVAANKMVFGNTYYYKLVTVMDDDTEKTSAVVSCRPTLARPKNVTIKQNTNGNTVLSWTAVTNAAGYEVYRNNKILATVYVNSYTDTTAKADTAYEYQIRAIHGIKALNSAYSDVVKHLEPLDRPVISVSLVAASGKVKIAWQPVDGAVKYQVWSSTTGKDGSYSLLTTTTATSHVHKGGKAGTIYYYKVKAIHETASANSAFSKALLIRCGLAQPVVTVSKTAAAKPHLTWPKVDGANGYQVWISATKNGTYAYLTATTGTSYTHTAAASGTTYYYKIRAYSTTTGLYSEFSAAQSSAVKLNKPTGLKVVNNAATGKNVISWNKVSGAASYQVWYSTTGATGSYKLLYTTKNLTHTHNNGVAGTMYYYKIKAVASAGSSNSDFSGSYKRTCDLAQPTGIKVGADAATGKNVISWNKVTGAAKYQVWVSTTGKTGSFTLLMTTKNLTHTHKKGVEGELYYYKVKAVHSNTNANSAFSAAVASLKVNVTVTAANDAATGKVKLSWNAVTGAAKYEVWYSTAAEGSFQLLTTTADRTYTHTDGVAGTKYYYKVKEVYTDTSKKAAFSNQVSQTCDLAQPKLTITHDAANTEKYGYDVMRFSWTDVGADSYDLYYYHTTNEEWTKFHSATATALLLQENTLTYKIQAIHSNPDANSAMSAAATLAK